MKSSCVVLGVVLATVGCGTNDTDRAYPIGFKQSVTGNAAYVTIGNVWNEGDALPLAETHCGKYGKIARFNRMQGYRAIFDCVKDT
jgi:hypothetical protein